MGNNPLTRMKNAAIRWLSYQLRTEHIRVQAGGAVVGLGTVLAPEAVIENQTGIRDSIRIGANSFLRGRLITFAHGGAIRMGDWCYVGPGSEIWSMDSISIGDRVLIAHDVNVHDHTAHSLDRNERHNHFREIVERGHPRDPDELPGVRSAPVIIEDDVWLSFGVTVLKGVRIGAGSVIAARSVVLRDVPPGVLYRNEISPVMTPLQSVQKEVLELLSDEAKP